MGDKRFFDPSEGGTSKCNNGVCSICLGLHGPLRISTRKTGFSSVRCNNRGITTSSLNGLTRVRKCSKIIVSSITSDTSVNSRGSHAISCVSFTTGRVGSTDRGANDFLRDRSSVQFERVDRSSNNGSLMNLRGVDRRGLLGTLGLKKLTGPDTTIVSVTERSRRKCNRVSLILPSSVVTGHAKEGTKAFDKST